MSEGTAFNINDALGRLMNNKKLYAKLLGKFEVEYAAFDEKVKVALDADNFEDGVHLAHTMKGLAGNLGAEDLQAVSKDLELLFKAGEKSPEFGPTFEKFSAELARAVKEVRDGIDLG
jgi:HPt (histidine-containing phosphotransfer) domain-containing protein